MNKRASPARASQHHADDPAIQTSGLEQVVKVREGHLSEHSPPGTRLGAAVILPGRQLGATSPLSGCARRKSRVPVRAPRSRAMIQLSSTVTRSRAHVIRRRISVRRPQSNGSTSTFHPRLVPGLQRRGRFGAPEVCTGQSPRGRTPPSQAGLRPVWPPEARSERSHSSHHGACADGAGLECVKRRRRRGARRRREPSPLEPEPRSSDRSGCPRPPPSERS